MARLIATPLAIKALDAPEIRLEHTSNAPRSVALIRDHTVPVAAALPPFEEAAESVAHRPLPLDAVEGEREIAYQPRRMARG